MLNGVLNRNVAGRRCVFGLTMSIWIDVVYRDWRCIHELALYVWMGVMFLDRQQVSQSALYVWIWISGLATWICKNGLVLYLRVSSELDCYLNGIVLWIGLVFWIELTSGIWINVVHLDWYKPLGLFHFSDWDCAQDEIMVWIELMSCSESDWRSVSGLTCFCQISELVLSFDLCHLVSIIWLSLGIACGIEP